MIVIAIVIIFFLCSVLRQYMQEMERRDALLRNATLSNASLFLIDEETSVWLAAQVLDNAIEHQSQRVEPEWALVLGTFTHVKDEDLEEFLVVAGVPFFVRVLILSASPTMTFDRVFQGDDYYYDLDNHYPDELYTMNEGREGKVYQMVLTIHSLITNTQRFRLGYTFTKHDYDGTPSKNTYVFKAPTVLFHHKEKEHINTSIIHTFNDEGLIMSIVNDQTGMTAKRYFKRQA